MFQRVKCRCGLVLVLLKQFLSLDQTSLNIFIFYLNSCSSTRLQRPGTGEDEGTVLWNLGVYSEVVKVEDRRRSRGRHDAMKQRFLSLAGSIELHSYEHFMTTRQILSEMNNFNGLKGLSLRATSSHGYHHLWTILGFILLLVRIWVSSDAAHPLTSTFLEF